jgi:hypothetical protein
MLKVLTVAINSNFNLQFGHICFSYLSTAMSSSIITQKAVDHVWEPVKVSLFGCGGL